MSYVEIENDFLYPPSHSTFNLDHISMNFSSEVQFDLQLNLTNLLQDILLKLEKKIRQHFV